MFESLRYNRVKFYTAAAVDCLMDIIFIEELRAVSAFTSNVKVAASDQIVSFCVVLPDGTEGRLLLSCKLTQSSGVTIGETAEQPLEQTTQAPAETTQAPAETPQA